MRDVLCTGTGRARERLSRSTAVRAGKAKPQTGRERERAVGQGRSTEEGVEQQARAAKGKAWRRLWREGPWPKGIR